MVPLRDSSLLDDGYAQFSVNTFLYRGTVRGFRSSASVYTLQLAGTMQVYRIPADINVKQNFATSYWFEFADQYLTAIRSPVVEDQFQRYYFFPSSGSPYFNTLANLIASAPKTGAPGDGAAVPGWLLGIPAPETAPGVVPAPGTDEARTYVYTWLNQFSEEGPNSPPTLVAEGAAIGTYEITVTPPPPADQLNRDLTSLNIYRTVTDSSGNTSFYLVINLPIATTTYADNFTDAEITNNIVLPSSQYTIPPADLQGVVMMANGIMAGWSNKKEIWFSDAYTPHSWPVAYSITVPYPIVGLAAVGSSLVILTEGPPSIATGITPSTMSVGGLEANEPCISRGSIVAAGEGVYYASPNGLILANPSGTSNVSLYILQKEDWINLNPYTFAAGKYSMAYVAVNKASALPNNGVILDHGAFSLATYLPAKQNTPFSFLSLPGPIENMYNDELSGQLFFLTSTNVFEWNPETANALLPYVWRSKDYRLTYPQNLVAGKIAFNIPPTVNIPVPQATTRNLSQTQVFNPATQYLLLRVFADGVQVMVREIQVSNELIMLPSGFKSLYWSFQIEGIVEVRFMQFATSVRELAKV